MKEALILVLAYFLGAIPIGLIVGKATRGIDIRQYGSGNIGATNVIRTLGIKIGAIVFIGDALKGLIPVLLAQAFLIGHHQPYFVVAAGLMAIIGHSASLFIGFKGGKAVSTSLGVIIGLNPLIAAIIFVLWLSIVAATRYVSIASIIASASVSVLMYFSGRLFGKATPVQYTVFALAAALLILLKHISNIKRLLNGTEPKFGQKVKLEGDESADGRDEPSCKTRT